MASNGSGEGKNFINSYTSMLTSNMEKNHNTRDITGLVSAIGPVLRVFIMTCFHKPLPVPFALSKHLSWLCFLASWSDPNLHFCRAYVMSGPAHTYKVVVHWLMYVAILSSCISISDMFLPILYISYLLLFAK